MQSKLTLRMEDTVIRKAKRLAKSRGKSVSRIVSEYIADEPEDMAVEELPPVTASMVGILARDGNRVVDEGSYKEYLEKKYL